LSYRRSWSRTFYPDEFKLVTAFGHPAPKICEEHIDPDSGRSRCFRADYYAPNFDTWGRWELAVPINLPSAMPGTKRKILNASCLGWFEGTHGIGGGDESYLRLFADGMEIFQSQKLRYSDSTPLPNTFPVDKMVDTYNELVVKLTQSVWAGPPSTWVAIHNMNLKIEGEYYTETPPTTASVEIHVIDSETGKSIKNARVTLKTGSVVSADGYTDSNGYVNFSNINEGSYTLIVRADEYNMLEQSIEVEAPAVSYEVKLVKIPAEPLPWWVIPTVAGVGVLAFVTVVPAVLKRPRYAAPPQPVIVVK